MPNSGSFMPGEFWYVMTILLGFVLVGIVSFIIKRFVDKLDVMLKSMAGNINQLTISYKLMEKMIEDHDKDIKDLQKGKRNRGQ